MAKDTPVICQKCDSKRIVAICGKVSDMFNADARVTSPCPTCGVSPADVPGKAEWLLRSVDGYVPASLKIGSGDYIEFAYCLDCGQIQGTWPAPPTPLEDRAAEEDDAGNEISETEHRG